MANARGSSRNAYGSAARRSGASSGTAKRPAAKTSAPRGRRHRLLGVLSVIFAALALACSVLRMLPEDLQALPYIPVIVSATPWFVILAVLALILSVISRRWIAMLMALACIGLQVWWQWPFFSASTKLPAAVDAAMASTRADTGDMIARVMTFNVYKGHADAKAIVDIVRDQRVEVLALQETTNDFVKKLDEAGIHSYLPYSQVSSSDGVYGNGIWSATELGRPVDDEVGSSASFMPGGTVTFGGGKAQLRFVSVHTTAPIPGYWSRWKRSLDELASMRSREGSRYVFMGDFNATTDHTPFRNILGTGSRTPRGGQGMGSRSPGRPTSCRCRGSPALTISCWTRTSSPVRCRSSRSPARITPRCSPPSSCSDGGDGRLIGAVPYGDVVMLW